MSQSPPSLSPAPRRTLVSSLVEKISPKIPQGHRRLKYGKVAANDMETDDDDDYVYQESTSLPGGERTSPLRVTPVQIHRNTNRPTFCIDSDDDSDSDSDCDSDGEPVPTPPELPSLVPPERIPANYICPLTLQIMEDPVHDSCGHTFERRAILEWLDRSHDGEAVCPISRKPLMPLGCGSSSNNSNSCSPCEESSSLPANEPKNNHSNSPSSSPSCGYDRVLKRKEGLQKRIQEWKLEHPLYQGVDADYAKRQRWRMLRRNTIATDDEAPPPTASAAAAINQNHSHHPIECPYGGETIDDTSHSDSDSRTHHRLSRFELMLLPQEREVLKILKDRSREKKERLDRSRRCLIVISIALAILVWIGIYMARKRAEEGATR